MLHARNLSVLQSARPVGFALASYTGVGKIIKSLLVLHPKAFKITINQALCKGLL